MDNDLAYALVRPEASLALFVDSFWMLHNQSANEKEVVGLPDGRIDLFFERSDEHPFRVVLLGIGTKPDQAVIAPGTRMFAISFKLPGAEYILRTSVSGYADGVTRLPKNFWDFGEEILDDFETFCELASQKIHALTPADMDERKRRLFELIYASNGEMSVQELSEKCFWSARQINRYFHAQFGVSLKTYGTILRFRASLEHIARGRLFPELDFTDQSHFIKEVRKFSGAVPKDLFRNPNDRFILLSAIRWQ